MCGCLSRAPQQRPGPQPRCVPWLGIEPTILWFTGRHSIHWPQQPEWSGFIFYTELNSLDCEQCLHSQISSPAHPEGDPGDMSATCPACRQPELAPPAPGPLPMPQEVPMQFLWTLETSNHSIRLAGEIKSYFSLVCPLGEKNFDVNIWFDVRFTLTVFLTMWIDQFSIIFHL